MRDLLFAVQVKYTGYRDRQPEDRKKKFIEDLNEGISSIVSGWSCLMFI